MTTALILGGTGQIGLAVAEGLAGAGWNVRLVSRTPPPVPGPWEHVAADRENNDALMRAVAGGADLILDCVAYEPRHADQLLALQNGAGRLAVISSASVYRDGEGRTLDEAAEAGFPDFPNPIPEDHPTVAPGSETYSTRKVLIERRLLDDARVPVSVLRPCAIHGPHSRHAREWWFVKRLLDGRRRIPLAYRGRSRFQTTSTAAIARGVLQTARGRASEVLNVTDADAPTTAAIGRAVMAAMGVAAELVGLPDAAYPPVFGATPWSIPKPMVCTSSVVNSETYAEAIPRAVDWLIGAVEGRDWQEVLPQLARYPKPHFDYDADDRALALPEAVVLGAE